MDSPGRVMSAVNDESLQTPAPPPIEDDDLRLAEKLDISTEMNVINQNGVISLRDYQTVDLYQNKIDLENSLVNSFKAPEPPIEYRLKDADSQPALTVLNNVHDLPLNRQLEHPLEIHEEMPDDEEEPIASISADINCLTDLAAIHDRTPPFIFNIDRIEPSSPVSIEVHNLMRQALDIVSKSNDDEQRLLEADQQPVEEIPSSPEPLDEPETPVDDFVNEYVNEYRRKDCMSRNAESPLKDVIITSKMDEEVSEVLKTYMKSQFGELRKRTAMHLLAIDERVGSYQADVRRISAPVLQLAHQLQDGNLDVVKLKESTGDILCLLRNLNERMLMDRRSAILNFFERPLELADEHRLPHRNGDGLFGKRFCYLNGLGFTKRRPRRRPAQRTYRPPASTTVKVANTAAGSGDEHSQEEFRDDEEFEEEEEEEEISDEEWKVSEDEEVDPEEEEEEDSELDSEEQEDLDGNNDNNDGSHSIEDMWNESVRLMQLADAAVDGSGSNKKDKKEKKKRKDSTGKRGRKKKQGDGPEDDKPRKRRKRKKSGDDDGDASYKRRKKDGPTIERKIDPHCEHCDFEADRRHLIMHVRKAHPDKMIQCEQCPKKFAFKVSLWNHVVIMHGTAKFKCTQCTRSFRSEEKLRMHSFMHSDLKPFACEICGKGCLTKRHLDAHVLIHEQRQQLYCQMCNRFFATNHNFRNHMKLHTGQKDFFCDICNAGFPIKARLTQHKRLHHSGEQYVCDICGKAFKARHILNDHKALRHSTEKSWVCEVCGAGFKLKSVLVRHLKTHSDERPYRCDICDKAFKDRSTLGVHRKTHSTDRPYLCEQCGMSFKRNAERKKHNCIGRMVHIPEDSSQSHHGQMAMPVPPQQPQPPSHHIVTHRPIPIATIMPHPATLMSPATPGTSLQAQIMQLLDENLHAAGSQHPQPSNFSVN